MENTIGENDLPKPLIGESGRSANGESDVFESSKLQMEKMTCSRVFD